MSSISFELRLDGPLTVGQLSRYVETIRAAGATDDTVLEEVHTPNFEPELLEGLVYRADELPPVNGTRTDLALPTHVVRAALDLIAGVAESDGDVRNLVASAQQIRSELHEEILSLAGIPEDPS